MFGRVGGGIFTKAVDVGATCKVIGIVVDGKSEIGRGFALQSSLHC